MRIRPKKRVDTRNEHAVGCGRCGQVMRPQMAAARVGCYYLCWRCATPGGVRTYWLFDRAVARQHRKRRAAQWLEIMRPAL